MSETRLALTDQSKLTSVLAVLQHKAASIVVKDAETCLEAKTAQRDVRNYLKDVKAKLDPFVNSAKAAYDAAKDERARWLTPAEAIDEALAVKVKTYERIEREAAEAETRRVNEHNRRAAEARAKAERAEADRLAAEVRKENEKRIAEAQKAGDLKKREAEKMRKEAAEAEARAKAIAAEEAARTAANVQTVTVAPSIPKVAGVPSRRNYRARIIDVAKIPDQWWIVDIQSLNAEAREQKKVGEIIPGVMFEEF
jgi:hypothetical protein